MSNDEINQLITRSYLWASKTSGCEDAPIELVAADAAAEIMSDSAETFGDLEAARTFQRATMSLMEVLF